MLIMAASPCVVLVENGVSLRRNQRPALTHAFSASYWQDVWTHDFLLWIESNFAFLVLKRLASCVSAGGDPLEQWLVDNWHNWKHATRRGISDEFKPPSNNRDEVMSVKCVSKCACTTPLLNHQDNLQHLWIHLLHEICCVSTQAVPQDVCKRLLSFRHTTSFTAIKLDLTLFFSCIKKISKWVWLCDAQTSLLVNMIISGFFVYI